MPANSELCPTNCHELSVNRAHLAEATIKRMSQHQLLDGKQIAMTTKIIMMMIMIIIIKNVRFWTSSEDKTTITR